MLCVFIVGKLLERTNSNKNNNNNNATTNNKTTSTTTVLYHFSDQTVNVRNKTEELKEEQLLIEQKA